MSNSNAHISNLSLAKYRICCRASEEIPLPKFKGAVLHGGFGFALKKISPYYYQRFCQIQSGPNPYFFLPPLETTSQYSPGHEFSFELNLIGDTASYFPICLDALKYLGGEMGLGKRRGKFSVLSIASAVPPQQSDGGGQNALLTGEAIGTSREYTGCDQMRFHFITPLRLKNADRILLTPPTFSTLFARIIGRLNSLGVFYGYGPVIEPKHKQELLALAQDIPLHQDHCTLQELNRYSTRQKQWMKFSGLQGYITYNGNFEPFWPYLVLGEWCHVGGKTSFGFGKYIMEQGD